MKNEQEQNQTPELSAEHLTQKIWEILCAEIFGVCTQKGNTVQVCFPSGKTLRISVKEK